MKLPIRVEKSDRPRYDKQKEVSVYTQEELTKFFAACNETETVWFQFFLLTGMREGEVQHVRWENINFERKTISVRADAKRGWAPKKGKERTFAALEAMNVLKTWKARANNSCDLIFPTSGCKPKLNFLDDCKAIAKRAGLDPENFWLHKFRATRATFLLQQRMPLTNVMAILGHTDLKSAMRYQGAQNNDVILAQLEQMPSMIGGV